MRYFMPSTLALECVSQLDLSLVPGIMNEEPDKQLKDRAWFVQGKAPMWQMKVKPSSPENFGIPVKRVRTYAMLHHVSAGEIKSVPAWALSTGSFAR